MFAKNRGYKVSLFGAVVIGVLVVFQGISAAHHPEVVATAVCYTETTARHHGHHDGVGHARAWASCQQPGSRHGREPDVHRRVHRGQQLPVLCDRRCTRERCDLPRTFDCRCRLGSERGVRLGRRVPRNVGHRSQ